MSKTASLAGPQAKLWRAHTHLNALYEQTNAFTNGPKTHEVVGEVESETVTEGGREFIEVFTIRVLREPDPDWGLLVGDFLQNLRASLDHLIHQLVLLNDAVPTRDNQFPICLTGTRYWCARKNGTPSVRDRSLKGISEDHRAGIDAVQPYRAGPRADRVPLAVLRDLSNADKHQVITTGFLSSLPLDLSQFDIATSIDGAIADVTHHEGLIKDGAEIMRVRFVIPDPDAKVQMNARFECAIGFGDLTRPVGFGTTAEGLGTLYEFVRDFLKSAAPVFGEEWDHLGIASTEIDHM